MSNKENKKHGIHWLSVSEEGKEYGNEDVIAINLDHVVSAKGTESVTLACGFEVERIELSLADGRVVVVDESSFHSALYPKDHTILGTAKDRFKQIRDRLRVIPPARRSFELGSLSPEYNTLIDLVFERTAVTGSFDLFFHAKSDDGRILERIKWDHAPPYLFIMFGKLVDGLEASWDPWDMKRWRDKRLKLVEEGDESEGEA